MKFLFSLLVLIVLTESCNSTKETATPENNQEKSSTAQQTLSGTYIVEEMESNKNLSEELSITFDESTNKISGFSGCNVFFGNYTIDGNTIRFGAIGASKKYCQGDKNILERQFFQILESANNFIVNGNSITLLKDKTLLIKANRKVNGSKQKTIGGKK